MDYLFDRMIFFFLSRFKCQSDNDSIKIYVFAHYGPTENILWSDTTLWPYQRASHGKSSAVLILVVLDTTLWLLSQGDSCPSLRVLILVVLDTTLWLLFERIMQQGLSRLNPCCAGYYSLTTLFLASVKVKPSLNPCCAGYYSLTVLSWVLFFMVLFCLNPCCAGYYSLTLSVILDITSYCNVLILVVLDTTLWLCKDAEVKNFDKGLNPCCAGYYSLTWGRR